MTMARRREKYDIEEAGEMEEVREDDELRRYPGPDLSDDPMLADDPRTPRRRRRRKAEREAEAAQAEQQPVETTDEEPRPRKKRFWPVVRSVLSGNILSRQEVGKIYPYLLLVAFLAFLYIGNVFRMQHLHRKQARLRIEVKELRAKSLTMASIKMNATRRSKIIEEVQRRGLPLRESLVPNKVIPADKTTPQDSIQ